MATLAGPEKDRIDAARIYIDKLRSMHPSEVILVELAEQERELNERERALANRERLAPVHAGC